MAITLYTGRPRQGKTLLAVKEIFKRLQKGEEVWSNIYLNYSGKNLHYYTKLEELYKVKNGTIFMDEAHVYMRSRKWESLPEEMERKLAQHGKHRLDIIATVQHQDRIDKILREIVDYWYVCQRGILFFVRWEFDIDGDKMKKFPLSKKYYFKRKKDYLKYDSYSSVEVGKMGEAIFEIQDGF